MRVMTVKSIIINNLNLHDYFCIYSLLGFLYFKKEHMSCLIILCAQTKFTKLRN